MKMMFKMWDSHVNNLTENNIFKLKLFFPRRDRKIKRNVMKYSKLFVISTSV